MSHSLKPLQFGHFLDFKTWQDAKALVDYQIGRKANHKGYNTLNFWYFEKVFSQSPRLAREIYFKKKISNNVFYGLPGEFCFFHYPLPKKVFGVRGYTFFGYPMMILYHSIVLYIVRVTQQYLLDNKNDKCDSFYGGDLKYYKDKNDVEVLKYSGRSNRLFFFRL